MLVRFACGIALVLASLCAAAQERIFVAVPPAFDFESAATAKLRKDCALVERVGKQVLTAVKERVPGTEPIDDWQNAGERPVVRLWITQLQLAAERSTAATGALNRMGLRAELFEASERRVFGDWRATATSQPGEAPCRAFERIAVTLGNNVAAWVPTALRTSAANRAAAEAAAKDAVKEPGQ
jgi:hypothetical protein